MMEISVLKLILYHSLIKINNKNTATFWVNIMPLHTLQHPGVIWCQHSKKFVDLNCNEI